MGLTLEVLIFKKIKVGFLKQGLMSLFVAQLRNGKLGQ
tara:strand:+ start:394 stop:507 length:114 start_codon:yes stop_codon:yes gene_type:complete